MKSSETIERQKIVLKQETQSQPVINLTRKENRVFNFFHDATPLDWEDWRWQLRNRIRTKDVLSNVINLTEEEIQGLEMVNGRPNMAIPPYFASLMDPDDPKCPIRLQCVPRKQEFIKSEHEMEDPCGEDNHSPTPGLVHRYPDRVLFLVSEMCPMYCRYCTRSRLVGDGKKKLRSSTYQAAFDYIRTNKKIRDVLISGGDPLILGDEILEDIIAQVKAIPHVEFVRLGTRVPVTLPQRITDDLIRIFKKYSPLWISIHFTHPKEITKRVRFACDLLAESGMPLGSQTVLLKGINDKPYIIKKLMQELLKIRVRPYYIYQCDPIYGSAHFRTPLISGINIIDKLRGHTSGYAVPTFVVDSPGGGGKIPVGPDYVVSKTEKTVVLKNFAGEQYTHYDPDQ